MTFDFSSRLRAHLAGEETNPLDPDSHACTNVSGTRVNGDAFWLQVHAGQLNFQHMHEPGKDELLAKILEDTAHEGDIELVEGSYVNFGVTAMPAASLDLLLDRLSFDYFETNFFEDLEFSTESLH